MSLLILLSGGEATPAAAARTISLTIEVQLLGVWTDITDDTVAVEGLELRYGIFGQGPRDRVSGTGELQFTLRNDAGNSVGVQGAYSPAHPSRRPGWEDDILCRLTFTSNTLAQVKFYGKVGAIAPEPGRYGSQRVHVTAYDFMRGLGRANARDVTLQVNKTEAELLAALIAVVPTEDRPLATHYDAGADSYPFAFDNLGPGASVLGVGQDVVVSSIGRWFMKGNGTLKYQSRTQLNAAASQFTIDDAWLTAMQVSTTTEGAWNRFRLTIHPKTISPTATEELYALPAGSSIAIEAGTTVEPWTAYTDPNNRKDYIGGTAVVTTLVAGTHYEANSAADGSGTDMTGYLTASVQPFASTAKWTLTNTHGSTTIYVRRLKVVGKAVRDPGPQTYEDYDSSGRERTFELDLPYQDDVTVAKSAATYLVNSYAFPQHIEAIEFLANNDATLMEQAITREPGDVVTVSETVTGLAGVTVVIQNVTLRVEHQLLWCRWGVAPAVTGQVTWQLGRAGYSELGSTTRLGF